MDDIEALIRDLRAYDTEREWFEFKENWFQPDVLGEYISAISNSAAVEGRRQGYFVWGIHDRTHDTACRNSDSSACRTHWMMYCALAM